jgi:hypothetical protein
MPQKPKARKAKSKAKSSGRSARAPSAAETQKEQSARFIEAARAIGVDESGREFERAIGVVAPPKTATKK